MGNRIDARLRSAKRYGAGEPVTLIFEIRNDDDRPVWVLKWFTPLEGLWSDCLEVTHDGESVKYDGLKAKRGRPGPEDFVLILPGSSVEAAVELRRAYDLSREGVYRVELNTRIATIVVANEGDFAPLMESRETMSLLGGGTEFYVEGGGTVNTDGANARAASMLTSGPAAAPTAKKPKDPKFNGGDAAKQKTAKQAHVDGFALIEKALSKLANDAGYVEWFGKFLQSRFDTVQKNYTTMRDRMESTDFTYDLTGTGCQANWYAYTTNGSTTIWLCDQFWKAPASGVDSQAGTMVHEHSHSDAMTDDIAGGQTDCRTLAKDAPDDAANNGDNYEYYAETR